MCQPKKLLEKQMPVNRKMFIFKGFGHRFTIFGEQAFSE